MDRTRRRLGDEFLRRDGMLPNRLVWVYGRELGPELTEQATEAFFFFAWGRGHVRARRTPCLSFSVDDSVLCRVHGPREIHEKFHDP